MKGCGRRFTDYHNNSKIVYDFPNRVPNLADVRQLGFENTVFVLGKMDAVVKGLSHSSTSLVASTGNFMR